VPPSGVPIPRSGKPRHYESSASPSFEPAGPSPLAENSADASGNREKHARQHMLFPHLLFWSGYRSLSFEKWSTRFPNTSLSLWMATDDGLDNAVGHAVVGTLREQKRSRHA